MSKLKETLNNFKNILSADEKVKAVTEMPVVMADAVAQDEITDKDEEDKTKDVKKDADEFVKDYENKDRKTFKASKGMKDLKLSEGLNDDVVIYQFPKFNASDRSVARREYNLEIVMESRKDTYAKGKLKDIKAFADEYLGYELVDDYFIYEDLKLGIEESLEIRVKDGEVYGPGGKLTKSFIDMLDRKAKRAYKENDDSAFYGFTDDALAILWATCMMSKENPFGKAYDDEAYGAIADRPNSREIFDMADKIYDAFFTPLEPEGFVDKSKNDRYTESVEMNNKLTLDESLFTDYKIRSKVFKESVLNKRRKSLNERNEGSNIEERPEPLEEGCGKKSLKEAKKKSGYDVYTLVYDCLIGGLKDDEKRPNIAETDKRVKVDDFVATKNDDVVIKTEDPEVIAYVNKIADILNLPVKEGEGTIGIELNAKTSEMPIEDFVEEMGIETPIKYVNVQYERRKAAKANK